MAGRPGSAFTRPETRPAAAGAANLGGGCCPLAPRLSGPWLVGCRGGGSCTWSSNCDERIFSACPTSAGLRMPSSWLGRKSSISVCDFCGWGSVGSEGHGWRAWGPCARLWLPGRSIESDERDKDKRGARREVGRGGVQGPAAPSALHRGAAAPGRGGAWYGRRLPTEEILWSARPPAPSACTRAGGGPSTDALRAMCPQTPARRPR